MLCLISVQHHIDDSAEIDCLKILSTIISKSFFYILWSSSIRTILQNPIELKYFFTSEIRSRVYLGALVLKMQDFNLYVIKDNKPGIEKNLPFRHHFYPNQQALRALHIAFHLSKVLPPT